MPGDDEQAPPVAKTAVVETRPAHLASLDAALADPETLVEALRYLQQRIPDYIVLTARERRSMVNPAHLHPQFVEVGIQAAGAWRQAKQHLKHTGDELAEQREEIRRWDEVERQLNALAKGVADANLQRKHRLGKIILTLYQLLGAFLRSAEDSYLRPYYEEMQRIYAQMRKGRKGAKEGDSRNEPRSDPGSTTDR